MSLEEPVIVSVVAIEETSFVVDVVTPPVVPAVDVTTVDPAAPVVVDIADGGIDVVAIEVTGFVVDVTSPPPLSAVDVTVGDPAATVVVDIPGSGGDDEVIGGTITIGSTPPSSPDVNDIWIDTEGGGGTGGGGGDDLDTTPVAPTGSTLARTMPEWLAGGPVIECPDDVLVTQDHLGCWLHMMNDIGSLVMLPDNFQPGWSFGVRQQGTGIVLWQYVGGSTVQMPFSKSDHTGIAEQYEEAVFRVLSNADGHSAVWGVSGGTF